MYYDPFYRQAGIRTAAQLQNPPLLPLAMLELPRNSLLHYQSMGPGDDGPNYKDPLFKNITKPIIVGHAVENGANNGNPKKLSISVTEAIRNFHAKPTNRRFKRMIDLEQAARDETVLLVQNYALLPNLYLYQRTVYSDYYRWQNIQAAMWQSVSAIAKETNRNQFIVLQLPKILPSMSDLNRAVGALTQKTVDIFDTHEERMILELWKWFGLDRAASAMGQLTQTELDKVNLIFVESGRYFVMNLGLMNKWRQATEEELKANPNANTKGVRANEMRLRFLNLMVALFEVRTVALSETPDEPDENNSEETDKSQEQPKVVVQALMKPVFNRATGAVEMKPMRTDMGIIQSPKDAGVTETGENLQSDPELEQRLLQDLAKLEMISKQAMAASQEKVEPEGEDEEVEEEVAPSLEDGVKKACDRLAAGGMISASTYDRYQTMAASYKTMPSPVKGMTMAEFMHIPKEMTQIPESPSIPDIPGVFDKTMLKSSLHAFVPKYVKEVMQRDVANMVMGIQQAGMAVTEYNVEEVENVVGAYRDYTIRVNPVEGAATTLRFKLPMVDNEGTFRANGVNYKLRMQKSPLPIVKVAPDRVALTSYYGKEFVSRSDKRVNDYGTWLCNAIMAQGLDDTVNTVQDLRPGDVFDNLFQAPRLYSILSHSFRGFTAAGFDCTFDHTKREKLYGADLKKYEKNGAVIAGVNKKGAYLVIGQDNTLYVGENNQLTHLGSIESILHLDPMKAPVEFAVLNVFKREIPIGFVLGYEMGLEKLMRFLKVKPRRVNAGQRVNLQADEYSIVFSDETLVFSRRDKKAAIILAGFNEYHKALRQFGVYDFNHKGAYLSVLEQNGNSVRYLREIDLLYQMFVDPITKELLIDMNEPTTFRGLLLRSCEMLLTDHHQDETDEATMRLRGYERMAGAVYTQLVQAVRSHSGRPGKAKAQLDMSPYAVWQAIAKDSSISLNSEINPIQNLKEMEAVTFSGTGGRSARSLVKRTRSFHQNSMGVISEATVDSSDVGINTSTSADPQFTSVRGLTKRYVIGETGATALLSTSALISAVADKDDPKRVNFISIQHSHGVSCVGYHPMPVRTGYEQVVAHRTGDLFAATAKKPGKVLSVNAEGIVVEFDDGEVKGYTLGRRFGAAAGLTIPHTIVSNLKEGQKFKEGTTICYNPGFFEPDPANPTNVLWKSAVLVKTALMESANTLEDSSCISQKTADLLKTETTTIRWIKLNFDQKLSRIVKTGQAVDTEDILCIIEDAVTANQNLFDEASLDTLRILSGHSPQAKAKGIVERIEVYYHGEKEDMSETVRAVVNASDKELAQRQKAAGKKVFTGSVDEGFRVEGDPLSLDTLAIKFHITGTVAAGVGDKGVFGHQMKTVFGQVLTSEVKTETGTEIHAIFGQTSIDARIVLSPSTIGTTATLLKVAAKRALKAYRS